MTVTGEDRREAAEALEAFKASGGTVRTGADAKAPARSLEAAAAEFDRMREAIEDQAPGIPDGEDLAEVSTAAAASADREDLEDQAEPVTPEAETPAPRTPEPTTDGIGPITVHADIALFLWPEERRRFPVEFTKAGRRVLLTATKTEPWLSERLQDQIAGRVGKALGEDAPAAEVLRKKIRAVFADLAEDLETDDDKRRALTPAAVRTVIQRTEAVDVYPSKEPGATYFEVTIAGLRFPVTSEQMGGLESRFLNTLWMSAFYEPLNATRTDWQRIQAYWTDPAIKTVHEIEELTAAEAVIDRLVEDLDKVELVTDAASMTGPEYAWFDESKNIIWVHGRRIGRFLEDLKRPGWTDGKLSTALMQAGYTWARTGKPRIGPEAAKGKDGKQTRCWPFKPGLITFRPPVTRALDVGDLLDQE